MKKISRESLTALCIGSVVVILNSWHVIVAWFTRPPETYFTGIAHYFADYFLYVSLMAQKGWIFTSHLFTNEALPPTWIYWLYTILGKLGNPFVVYNASIPVCAAVALYLWWRIIQETLSERFTRVLAFLFITTASGFLGYDFWFSPLPALNRLGGVPHQIFQTILLLGVVLAFEKPVFLAFLSFLAALTNPIQMLLLAMAIIVVKPKHIGYLLPAAFGAYMTNAEFARDPILATAKLWEVGQPVSVSLWQFLLAVGPIALLIPFGVKSYIRTLTPIRSIILYYSLLSLIAFLSPIPHLLGTSPIRWLSPAAYTALPILAAFGFTHLRSQLKNDRRKVDYMVKTILFTVYLVITLPSLFAQIQSRTNAPRDLLYVPIKVIQSLRNLPGEGVVLTDPKTAYDVLVPVLTGRKTFTGHPIHTLYPAVKEELRNKYFDGHMTEEEKQKFLTDHNITTVYEP